MPSTVFADRSAAGQLLAAELEGLVDRRPIVFGLPRCGVAPEGALGLLIHRP